MQNPKKNYADMSANYPPSPIPLGLWTWLGEHVYNVRLISTNKISKHKQLELSPLAAQEERIGGVSVYGRWIVAQQREELWGALMKEDGSRLAHQIQCHIMTNDAYDIEIWHKWICQNLLSNEASVNPILANKLL